MSSGWRPKHRQLFFQIFQEGAKVIELPLGGAASRFLDQRARVLVNEIESTANECWRARSKQFLDGRWSGDMCRSIPEPVGALERLIETFSESEFLDGCSGSALERRKAAGTRRRDGLFNVP